MEEKTKTTGVISWGQLFLLVGVLMLFLYALTARVTFEKEIPKVPLVGYVFRGSELVEYTGQETDFTIPEGYSLGDPVYYSGVATFNNQSQAWDFWQEHYAVGAEGYYEFYQQIYTHSYPWVYEYTIGRPTYMTGRDILVTSTAWGAVSHNQYIEKVRIPSTIKTLGVRVFEYCPNLQEVYFEDGVTLISDGCFDGCEKLKKVRIPNTLERIDAYAFFSTAIEEIELPATVKDFHIGTFYDCQNLKTVKFNSMINANDNTYYEHFGNCKSLVSIYIPNQYWDYYHTTIPWSKYTKYYKGF